MITIVVTALNEEEYLAETVYTIVSAAESVSLEKYEIIIVNDGSTDRTAAVLNALVQKFSFIRPIHHQQNKGIGYSFLEAVNEARFEKVTIFAGDNNATFYMVKNLLANLDKADLVIAYTLNTECRGRLRSFLSALFSNIYTLTFDLHIKYINGSPIYPVEKLKKLPLKSDSYSLFAEINVRLLRSGISYYEVEGYVNPNVLTSSALRLRNLVDVIRTYSRLVYDVYFKHKAHYSKKSFRTHLPPGIHSCPPEASQRIETAEL